MMSEVLLWRLIAGAALAIVSYMAQQWFKRLNAKIDELINTIKEVALMNERQSGDIRMLKQAQEVHERRLNNHSDRLKKIEQNGHTKS